MIDFNTHTPPADQMPQTQQHNNMVYQNPTVPTHLPVTPNPSDNYFNNQYQTETSNSGMRPNFPLSSAPLAALHSMAGSGDMKTSQTMTSPTLAGYNPAAYYSMKNCLNGTPHGITDILSRPDLQALQARLGQGMYYNSCSQGGGQVTSPSKESRNIYWPSNNGQQINSMHQQEVWPQKHVVGIEKGPDGKKKNTRPTFSGSQIFALEKTFEQQKYLAGPERGRLAYALGMSESQVKVWFQNRRTKWRKRHAVEQNSKRRGDNPTNQTPPSYEQSQKTHQVQTPDFNNLNTGVNSLHGVLN